VRGLGATDATSSASAVRSVRLVELRKDRGSRRIRAAAPSRRAPPLPVSSVSRFAKMRPLLPWSLEPQLSPERQGIKPRIVIIGNLSFPETHSRSASAIELEVVGLTRVGKPPPRTTRAPWRSRSRCAGSRRAGARWKSRNGNSSGAFPVQREPIPSSAEGRAPGDFARRELAQNSSIGPARSRPAPPVAEPPRRLRGRPALPPWSSMNDCPDGAFATMEERSLKNGLSRWASL
jgi:hypothetical protein